MTTKQVTFTEEELLANHKASEPLVAGGVRCHGGFDADGTYFSPRTLHRVPAIDAWQELHKENFGTDLLDIPLETWPAHFPNLEQARFLISSGVREPLIATLTRIGTVEGFGANIRHLAPGNLQPSFDESIEGTATDHLGRGLFEAHGRDEAGFEEEAGHKDMWFAARDIAFENPTANIDVDAMLGRMGFGQNRGGGGGGGMLERFLPDDIDGNLEAIASLMIRVLLIEIQAFHTFAWAEQWLSDDDLVAGDGEAAKIVKYIRSDESPHVAYLKTALTEMRDRTWIGSSGKKYAGTEMIGRLWERALDQSLGTGRRQNVHTVFGEVEHWCNQRSNGRDLIEQFRGLADEGVLDDVPGAAGADSQPVTY
jgi:hypothetical protein